MFDLVTGKTRHMPSGGRTATILTAILHVALLTAIVVLPLLFVTNTLPDVPAMMAFVAAMPVALPAPPPPPPAPRADVPALAKAPASNPNAAPVDAPSRIEADPAERPQDDRGGVVGGVEGGMPGGVAGGVVGGLTEPSPPPPPPVPPPPMQPVRLGGEIRPPALLKRVDPIYPDIALNARVEGTVILEAVIDEQGAVQSVRTLRSIPLLEKAAIAALEQWRYSPTILNGRAVPVVLTVTMTFKIPVI